MALTEEGITEKCAVFGAYNVGPEAARLTYYGLWALQHRGQESSGIASSDGQQLHRHTAPGLVANVYREEDLEQLPGQIAIGHNRYSTSGGADGAHPQPIIKPDSRFALAHNGNFPVTDKLEQFLDQRGVQHAKLNDSEMMAEVIHSFIEDGQTLGQAVESAYPHLEGVFSAVAMTNDTLVAFRDHHGIRPLSIGRLGDGYVVSSETCAFDTIGATFVRDVAPGELVVMDASGLTSRQVVPGDLKLDIFEFVYFARPDSVLQGRTINEVRHAFGEELAREWPVEADIVVPVPDSSIPAALGYARTSGIPFEIGIIKNRYIHRTFIRPNAKLRNQDTRMKLNPMRQVLEGKRVILIDDSIVRGTTTRKIIGLLYEAGAREVHVRISSPPVVYPDFYGINISDQTELIAAHMTPQEIGEHIGADSLGFLSYDGMMSSTGLPEGNFSTSCFSGVYPISIGRNADAIQPMPTRH